MNSAGTRGFAYRRRICWLWCGDSSFACRSHGKRPIPTEMLPEDASLAFASLDNSPTLMWSADTPTHTETATDEWQCCRNAPYLISGIVSLGTWAKQREMVREPWDPTGERSSVRKCEGDFLPRQILKIVTAPGGAGHGAGQGGRASCCLSWEGRNGAVQGPRIYAYLLAQVLISRLGKTWPEINV